MILFLTDNEALVYGLIGSGSYNLPITLAAICRRTGMSEREVKGIVESLGNEHDVPVGARRLLGKRRVRELLGQGVL
ncbi:MAG TPA: hypothetical protein VMW15_07735 [Terracidiphilus sp.]|nr:hypothetical protein [Terracidiphilus sp.]